MTGRIREKTGEPKQGMFDFTLPNLLVTTMVNLGVN